MIEIKKEPLLKLSQAARTVPPDGLHVNTLRRWIKSGCKGVRLESLMIGGKVFTSEAAIGRFIAATNASSKRPAPPPKPPRKATRTAAKRFLDETLGPDPDKPQQQLGSVS